jgi:hypothetical protein
VIKRTLPAAMRWIFWLGPIGIYLIRSTMRGALRKYPKEYDEEELKAALTKIRVGLQASSTGYLLGDALSFAGAPGLTRIRIGSMTREGGPQFGFSCYYYVSTFCFQNRTPGKGHNVMVAGLLQRNVSLFHWSTTSESTAEIRSVVWSRSIKYIANQLKEDGQIYTAVKLHHFSDSQCCFE